MATSFKGLQASARLRCLQITAKFDGQRLFYKITACFSSYFTECSICLLGLRILYLLSECVYTLDPQFACGFILCREFYVEPVTDVQMKTLCSKVVFQGTAGVQILLQK